MYYDKRIRYLSYYESDIKLQNAGYVKFQVRDSLCQMIVYVKGPRMMGNGEAAVYLLSRKKEEADGDSFYPGGRDSRLQKHLLGNLSIRGGQGHCAVRMNAENMADSGLRYDEICGIRIALHEYQYLESQWSVVNFMPERRSAPGKESPGYMLRRQQNTGRNGESGGLYGRNAGEDRPGPADSFQTEEPVEIDLIVTPVSENVRVEKFMPQETTAAERQVPFTEEPENGNIYILNRGPAAEEQAAFTEAPEKEDISISEEEPAAEEQVVFAEEPENGKIFIREEEPVAEEQAALAEPSVKGEELLHDAPMYGENMPVKEAAADRKAEWEEGGLGKAAADSMEEMLEREVHRREQSAEAQEPRSAEQELQSDKWEQLRNTYPIVHPIREEEEYLKITPRDFVIFTEKYQQLVHNSFLLHGYRNYKHLILGKKEKDGRTVYYLGVPGTFHEREKTVAVMFGFEAFDGKREPAQNGDFGYYLRRVEI